MQTETVEIVLFELAAGVSDAEFLAAAQALEPWLEAVGGFQRRELSRDAEGHWVDIVYWDSLAQAQQAAAQIMESEVGQQFGSKIAGESIQMFHMSPAHRFG